MGGLGSGKSPLTCLVFLMPQLPSKALVPEMEAEDEEDDSEDAINEFDFLGSGEDGEGSPDPRRGTGEGTHRELGELRASGQPSSPSVVGTHTAACSCFLPQGLHRTDTLPERRVAKESRRSEPRRPGPPPFPGNPPHLREAGCYLKVCKWPACFSSWSCSFRTISRQFRTGMKHMAGGPQE